MGTLEKDGSSKPLSFDGKAASWPPFKTAFHKFLDKVGCGWVVERGNAFCVMLQAAAAKAAKSKTASENGTVSTNVADYAKKDLQAAFASATVTTSDLHALGGEVSDSVNIVQSPQEDSHEGDQLIFKAHIRGGKLMFGRHAVSI